MDTQIKRSLGFWVALSIVVGGAIGSGIFKKPAAMSGHLGDAYWLIAVWVITGVISLFGALTNAEIASMMPSTGGQYVFYKKVYGNFMAYIYGWALFSVIQSGSIASILYVFAEYSQKFINLPRLDAATEHSIVWNLPIGTIYPLENIGVKGLTIAIIWLLTLVNARGAVLGGTVQLVFTALKLFAMLFIVGIIFGFGGADSSPSFMVFNSETFKTVTVAGIVAAMSGAFWAYDGWNNLTYVAGEVKTPQRNIPRALLFGLLIVMAVYIIINFAYLYVYDVAAMATHKLVAADAVSMVIGLGGALVVAAAIMLSTFGAGNGSILASSRVYYAMAQEGYFFKWVKSLSPKYSTPINSLVLQATWASVLVLSGTFDMLTDMLVFVAWIFYTLSALSVILLRVREPNTPRPYKVPGYPVIPILFILVSVTFLVITLKTDITDYLAGKVPVINSLFGLVIVALGIPFYFYFKKQNKA